jgi:hypothetical protein
MAERKNPHACKGRGILSSEGDTTICGILTGIRHRTGMGFFRFKPLDSIGC